MRKLTKSKPNKVQVCWMIFASHFSFGSGGSGVPAIGCGLGRVAVPVLLAFFAEGRGPVTLKKKEELSLSMKQL